MTSPQGPAREKRWRRGQDDHGNLTWFKQAPDEVLRMDFTLVADYLNALEAERDAYRQTLEKIAEDPRAKRGWTKRLAAEALALSSAGRETMT